MRDFHDRELIYGLKQGNTECFRLIFEKYNDLYFSFARGLLKNREEAECVVQESFIKLWVRRSSLDEEVSFQKFMFILIRNGIYNYMRRSCDAGHSGLALADIDAASPGADIEYTPNEIRGRIGQVVGRMPPQRKLVFTISSRERLSNAEIAERLDVSQRTVEKHLEDALHQLCRTLNVSVLSLIMWLF